jgi:polyisoprenoid-binding protein YceI
VMYVRGASWVSVERSSLPEDRFVSKGRVLWLRAPSLLAIFLLSQSSAEQLSFDLDRAKTNVGFVVRDRLHTVRGTFHLKQGQVIFDSSTGVISGDVVIDAASGNSGNTTRDKRMTRDILEAQRYPEIRFIPSKIAGSISESSTSSVEITGSFVIHGEAHEITIPMQVQISQSEITTIGKFVVPYVQWGMKNPSNFLLKVNEDVMIEICAVGHLERP